MVQARSARAIGLETGTGADDGERFVVVLDPQRAHQVVPAQQYQCLAAVAFGLSSRAQADLRTADHGVFEQRALTVDAQAQVAGQIVHGEGLVDPAMRAAQLRHQRQERARVLDDDPGQRIDVHWLLPAHLGRMLSVVSASSARSIAGSAAQGARALVSLKPAAWAGWAVRASDA